MTKKWLAALAALVLAALSPLTALADKTDQYNYTYGPNGIVASVPGFDLARTLDSGDLPEGTVLWSVDDLVVGGGRLYVADALGAQIHVFDSETFTHVVTIQSGSEEAAAARWPARRGSASARRWASSTSRIPRHKRCSSSTGRPTRSSAAWEDRRT